MASLEYFRHDSRARRDKRLRLLRAKYGRNGVCIFWDMIEELAEDEDHRLPYNYDYLYLSLQCSSDEDKEALRFIIEESGLISIDENRDEIYSPRLIKHAGLVASKTNGTCNETYNESCNGASNGGITEEQRRQRREAGRKSALKRWNKANNEPTSNETPITKPNETYNESCNGASNGGITEEQRRQRREAGRKSALKRWNKANNEPTSNETPITKPNETYNESITEGNESCNETHNGACNGESNESITKVTEITEHNGEGNETCNENITERGGIIGGGKTPNNKIQNTKDSFVVSNSSLRSEFGAWALNFWNENVEAGIPKLKSLTKDRLDKLISRCDEMGKRTLPDAQEHFAELIKRMNKSPFCRGEGSTSWKASFDWLFRNNYNQLKVLEGNYDPNSDEAYRQNGEYRSWRASRQANKNINDQW